MTSPVRNNILLLLLVAVVSAVTALNSYTTNENAKVYLEGVKYNNEAHAENIIVSETLFILATRDRQLDAAMATLMAQTERLEQTEQFALYYKGAADAAIAYIGECRALLEKNKIKPPALPGETGQPTPAKKKEKDDNTA